MRLFFLQIIILLFFTKTYSQDIPYFNNIYQHNNNFAAGRTILQTKGGYVGYGATEDPSNVGGMLVFFKIDNNGNELIWKTFGENNHNYYPGIDGGAMIETYDGNFVVACPYDIGVAFSSLIKLDYNLDTIWQKKYETDNLWTMATNCENTNDNGYILVGSVRPLQGTYWDALLIKTDSLGNMLWYNTFDNILHETGRYVIQTPDKGYLIGGSSENLFAYHTLNAMVIKTDSLGNEEWTHYYGNPDIADDMALVAMADDGNFLVATQYGDEYITNVQRHARLWIFKINTTGDIIEERKYGASITSNFPKNLRLLDNGEYILSGYKFDQSDKHLKGWIFKFSENLDSLWMRDYFLYDAYESTNQFYDASSTADNGFIAIGKACPADSGATTKMWIVKVDSMGCDTPGCATGGQVFDILAGDQQGLWVWPNPASGAFNVQGFHPPGNQPLAGKFKLSVPQTIRVYNSQGIKVEEITIPAHTESISLDATGWNRGLYFVRVECGGEVRSSKLIVH